MPSARTALITGAAMGIGAGIAERFLEDGYAVAAFDIDEERVCATVERLAAKGRAIAIAGDVASEDDVRNAVERTVGELETLDVLVNNAGIEFNRPVTELPSDDWDRQLAVNLRGAFLFSKYAVPKMRSRGGAIINISSVHAFVSWPGSGAYDVTKAGLLGLTRAMAIDHGPKGIRVNAICPGYIDTPLMDRFLAAVPDRERALREILGFHPVGRIGTPRDIAEAALFLASDAASFISGTSLVVDGAMTAAGH